MNMTNELILDSSKILWHKDRVEKWFKGERVAPITIDMALTTNCTFRCVYCYGKLQRINTNERISEQAAMHFMEDAAAVGVKAISFVSDGESTCVPYMKDVLLYAHSLGLDVALGTNGYLLGRSELEELLPVLTYIRFNISAADRQRYLYIHGVQDAQYDKVIENIRTSVSIKKDRKLPVTIGMQMVLMPEFADQILPLSHLGAELGVDYLVIKHCSDDEDASLDVHYDEYDSLTSLLKEAEALSTPDYKVSVKWSKMLSKGKRKYTKCFGNQFIMQISGSGIVAPCGAFFNEKYKKFHIGNLNETRFRDMINSQRYWDVMNEISSPDSDFNAMTDCGTLCLQDKTNEVLTRIKETGHIPDTSPPPPMHLNFI